MAAFNYIAVDDSGSRTRGILEADSPRQVRQLLRQQQLTPLSVAATRERLGKNRMNGFFTQVGLRDLTLLSRYLATLLQAGLPAEEALAVVSQQTHKGKICDIVLALRARVLEGHTLSHGLEEYAHIFPHVYRASVAAGEYAGRLDEVMARLAEHLEKTHEFRQKVLLSLLYPALLLVLSIAIISALMVFVVPDVIAIFIDTGQALPLLTQALIGLSGFIGEYGLPVLLMALLALAAGRFVYRMAAVQLLLHRQLLRLPLVGRFSRGVNCARFARTLNVLFNSGVPLVDAMKVAAQVSSNQWLRLEIEKVTQQVAEGGSLSAALRQSGHFPPVMVQMIASGEAGGELSGMLQRVAQDQEREIQTLVRAGVGLLEPLMLLLMGMTVLFIVLAILLPIMNLNRLVV